MGQALDDTELRRAGTWIDLDFRVRRADRTWREKTENVLGIAARRGPLGPVEPFRGAIAEEVLHRAIHPPSITISVPVTNLDSFDAR